MRMNVRTLPVWAMLAAVTLGASAGAQESARCLQQYAAKKQSCDTDLAKCKRHVQLTGEQTSCDEQYAYCQKRWKQIIHLGDRNCFRDFAAPEPPKADLIPD